MADKAAELKKRGTEEFKNKNYEEAATLYGEAIAADGSDHVLFSNRSAAYASARRYEEALADARRCVELKPDFAKGIGRVGFALYHLNRLLEAQQSYQDALALDPANSFLVNGLKDVEEALKAHRSGTISRKKLLAVLEHAATVQRVVQPGLNAAAQQVLAEGKTSLSFIEAHRRVAALALPQDPFELHGLTEMELHQILGSYETDQDVMMKAQAYIHPEPRGDMEKIQNMKISTLVEIHQFMVKRMQTTLDEFLQLPLETRNSIPRKAREHTAELLVSVDVSLTFQVASDDLEGAVVLREQELQHDEAFVEATEELNKLVQALGGPPPKRATFDVTAEEQRKASAKAQKPSTEATDGQPKGKKPPPKKKKGLPIELICGGASVALVSLVCISVLLRSRRPKIQ